MCVYRADLFVESQFRRFQFALPSGLDTSGNAGFRKRDRVARVRFANFIRKVRADARGAMPLLKINAAIIVTARNYIEVCRGIGRTEVELELITRLSASGRGEQLSVELSRITPRVLSISPVYIFSN